MPPGLPVPCLPSFDEQSGGPLSSVPYACDQKSKPSLKYTRMPVSHSAVFGPSDDMNCHIVLPWVGHLTFGRSQAERSNIESCAMSIAIDVVCPGERIGYSESTIVILSLTGC